MKKSVLFVDDELSYLESLSSLALPVDDITCKTCDNGQDALDIMKKESFDAVFFFLVMPKMGGMQILKEMQEQNIVSKIFVVSGYLNSDIVLQCKQYGAYEVIEKPIDPSKVQFILSSVI